MPSSRTNVRRTAVPQPGAETAGLKQGIRKWLFTVRPGGSRERSKGVTSRIIQDPPDKDAGACPDDAYEAPAIAYLGTLRELTLGGTTGPTDAVGGAGDTGSM
jgi:hypothetical protein